LRHLSKALVAFGYEVREMADRSQAASFLSNSHAMDLLILDADPNPSESLELCRAVSSQAPLCGAFTFLLVREKTPEILTESLEAGVDDFLDKPVVYGALLSRLRAAARTLEFERRWQRLADVDPLTSLRRTFAKNELREKLGNSPEGTIPTAAVALDLDCLGQTNHAYGFTAGNALIRQIAELLKEHCEPSSLLIHEGGGRFTALLIDATAAKAAEWAEDLRQKAAERGFAWNESVIPVTLSAGVATCECPLTALDDALAAASAAIQTAKHSGRNCVVETRQFDSEDATAWAEFASPGKIFERTTARDIMTPCALRLQTEDPLTRAASLFRRTRQSVLAVVHIDGKLAGLLFRGNIAGQADDGRLETLKVSDAMTVDAPTFDEEATFAELRAFFTEDARPVAAILRHGRPEGLVTPDNLAALTSALSRDTFASPIASFATSAAMIVPDLCPLTVESGDASVAAADVAR
jgi:diguanylate cyclase (GGDEF)-like protein